MFEDNNIVRSRVDEARLTVKELINDMENQNSPIEKSLMKAQKLARLLRDSDAQTWLDLENKGYPNNFHFSTLGTCSKYAETARFEISTRTYLSLSLPVVAAYYVDQKAIMSSFKISQLDITAQDSTTANTTVQLMQEQLDIRNKEMCKYEKITSAFFAIKGSIHSYAVDCLMSIEFGDIAQDIFEEAREEVDTFIRAKCPQAAEKIIAINERMREGNAESRSAALTSCRRLLMSVADAIFPPSEDNRVDGKGKSRKVGSEQYINRISAFLELKLKSESTTAILDAEINHLAARLEAVYKKSCKGVHHNVTIQETRLAVIQTYLIITEIARLDAADIST